MTIDLLTNPGAVVTPLKPIWYVTAQLSLPLGDQEIDAVEFAMAMALVLRMQVNLYDVFSRSSRRGRSIQEDQMELFHQIEDNISAMGVDGHACILRFICEMQTNRFSASSIFGEIFTLMFTPKQGDDYTLLKEYIEAEMAGAEGSQRCSERYLTCPVSVFSALRSLSGDLIGGFSTPQDKPLNSTSLSSGVSYLQDSLPWMENHL
ncbi:uncharacterized protein LOC119597842 isoform X1 [Penaeus monodon]|uniref:uncharacterized protein LOC119597842 isoform X1 n=1 Tax=Penaeus monodon TaxID=6687 RepID=UPI0018A7B4C8|nr:uncharacterized protein LOC119597842 isoform X1 [Penaeus monodon]